jgi:hypothetical protein
MDPKTGLDYGERRQILPLPGLELLPLCRAARSEEPSRHKFSRLQFILFNSTQKETPEKFFNFLTKINMYNIKTLFSEV